MKISALIALVMMSSLAFGHGFPTPPSPRPTPGLGGGVTPPVTSVATRRTYQGRTTRRPTRAMLEKVLPLEVEWTASIPVLDEREDYDQSKLPVSEGLRREQEQGGWARKDRPSIILCYDPSRKDQRKAVNAIEAHPRFRAASRLFNCFKVDSRSLDKSQRRLRLQVFDRDGRELGSIGSQSFSGTKALRLLGQAFTRPIGKELAQMEFFLREEAKAKDKVKVLEHALVCPDCGKNRDDAKASLEGWRERRETLRQRVKDIERQLRPLRATKA